MTLRELSIHFDMAPDALEAMLDILVRKEQVRRVDAACGAGCKGCTCADRAEMIFYEPAPA
jgi:hypothetical protein